MVADTVADGAPTATLLVNGGEITFTDAVKSLEHGYPLVVLAGTGRAADAIAAAATGSNSDPRAQRLAASVVTRIVEVRDGAAVAAAIGFALTTRAPA